jgi:tetratricopeptide (TPR) repeat protein
LTGPLPSTTAKRLGFIRFLYTQGLEQSHQAEPLSATALLSFHDAVELFLVLAGEHLNASLPTAIEFMEYWEKLTPYLPGQVPLGHKKAMARMNKLRANLKHHGSIPSVSDLEQLRADVTSFLADSTSLVFGADFEHLKLTDLITQVETRRLVELAEAHAKKGEYVEALGELSKAFQVLLQDYAERKRIGDSATPYTFGSDFVFARHVPREVKKKYGESLGRFLGQLYDTVTAMQEAMKVMAVGIDYRRYARFSMLTPVIHRDLAGGVEVIPKPGLILTKDDYEFCYQFVISAALRLAEVDFDLDLDALRRAYWQAQRKNAQPDGN